MEEKSWMLTMATKYVNRSVWFLTHIRVDQETMKGEDIQHVRIIFYITRKPAEITNLTHSNSQGLN